MDALDANPGGDTSSSLIGGQPRRMSPPGAFASCSRRLPSKFVRIAALTWLRLGAELSVGDPTTRGATSRLGEAHWISIR